LSRFIEEVAQECRSRITAVATQIQDEVNGFINDQRAGRGTLQLSRLHRQLAVTLSKSGRNRLIPLLK
jgi:hypothetical protein